MLKIIEIHAATDVQGEYVVLQNLGLTNVPLRGLTLCSDTFPDGDAARIADEMYIFRDDVQIKPYTRVVLFTGHGENGWVPTIDGKQAYCAYWGRNARLWSHVKSVHVLHQCATRRTPSAPQSVPQSV